MAASPSGTSATVALARTSTRDYIPVVAVAAPDRVLAEHFAIELVRSIRERELSTRERAFGGWVALRQRAAP